MPELEVAAADAGARLDRYLAEQEMVGSRGRAERLIEQGRVLVDGHARPKSYRLPRGATVSFPEPEPPAPPPASGELGVLLVYADEYVLVVDKPAGLLTHPAPGFAGPTLVSALAGMAGGGEPARAGIVHRLDRDTSGLLVVARDEITLARLQGLLRRRRIERTYLGLVRGRPPSRRGRIEAAMGRDRRDPTRMSLDTDNPRDAVTHFELAQALPGHSLLRVRLETGRTHQIRVHLAAIGHPVAGDPVYCHGPELGLQRQFLHAAELRFPHPHSGEPVEAVSPLPADLGAALVKAANPGSDPGLAS
ncbi:MAG: RluA family pseudouridine synthase [Gaiellales bacterium]